MSFVSEVRALEAFTSLPRPVRNLVFYSEGPEYWPHFRGVVRLLIETHKCPLIYVGSSENDPGLKLRHPLVRTFHIGDGGARVQFFSHLAADVAVLTMPDLAQLTLARSDDCDEYVYLFHSPVSTHMVYRPGAFDHYDTVFCVGPHHDREIRQREQMLGLEPKRLFAHGYSRLDEIARGVDDTQPRGGSDAPQVLIAPSWGENGILETIGPDVVRPLLDTGFKVVVRPHPQTLKLAKTRITELEGAFGDHPGFTLEVDMSDQLSFHESDVMISDWSGAALDFAFSRLRPVVFIDTPRKVNNPDYGELGLEPVEAAIRERVGVVVAPGRLQDLPHEIDQLIQRAETVTDEIAACRDAYIYNFGSSDAVAADELARIAFSRALDVEDLPASLEDHVWDRVFSALKAAPEAETADGELALIPLLNAMADERQSLSDPSLQRLDALCRRIDVFKALHDRYDAALAKPAGPKNAAPSEAYPALCLLMVQAARQTRSANSGRSQKYLNSAGNAMDGWVARRAGPGAPVIESLLARAHDEAGTG